MKPRHEKKHKNPGSSLPFSVSVRFGGRIVANLVVNSDESLVAEWLTDLATIPWVNGDRERLAYNAAKIAEAMNLEVCISQEQVYNALWPTRICGGKVS